LSSLKMKATMPSLGPGQPGTTENKEGTWAADGQSIVPLQRASRHRYGVSSFQVVTVHGCDNRKSRTIDVFVGGLDTDLRDAVIARLQRAGFAAAIDTRTPGRLPGNICNKGHSGAGIQLEIPRRLRNRL